MMPFNKDMESLADSSAENEILTALHTRYLQNGNASHPDFQTSVVTIYVASIMFKLYQYFQFSVRSPVIISSKGTTLTLIL